eukprot:Nk52_evm13s1444 gene=Nk52_evmTU13s1444
MGEEKDKEKEEEVTEWIDPRAQWMSSIILSTLKLKDDKWTKLKNNDESRETILEFLDKKGTPSLIFYLNAKDELTPGLTPQRNMKKKSVYFTKRFPNKDPPLKLEDLPKDLNYGDLSYKPLEQLSVLVEELSLSILSNPENQRKWPLVVAEDILKHFEKLKGDVFVINGKVKGKTLLPLPSREPASMKNIDKSLLHAVESAVIEWTHHIKDVLKSNSLQPLVDGLQPGPLVEIDFWAAKASNLTCIYEQLRSNKVKKLARLLQVTKSSYFPAFKHIFQEVICALKEAKDINMYLSALRPHIEAIYEQDEFSGFNNLWPILFRGLTLVWKNSEYYNTPVRILVLLEEITNAVIEKIRQVCDPEGIFKNEPQESKEKLDQAIESCNLFVDVFHKTRLETVAENEKDPKVCKWDFDVQSVFKSLNAFIVRLMQIKEYFDVTMEFIKLEKVEVGGTKGKVLSNDVLKIFKEYDLIVQKFASTTYDSLDFSLPDFEKDIEAYKECLSDMDYKLSSIISQAMDDCNNHESFFKILDSFGSLLERPLVCKEFKPKYDTLIQMLDDEVTLLSKTFLEHKDKPDVALNMPPSAGAMKWGDQIIQRLRVATGRVEEYRHLLPQTEELEQYEKKVQNLEAMLAEFSSNCFKDWADAAGSQAEANLDLNLIKVKGEETEEIATNFDPQIIATLAEVKYLYTIEGTEIPENAAKIYEKNNTFRDYIVSIDIIVSQFNEINSTLIPVEEPLLKQKLENSKQLLQKGISNLTWKSSGIEEFIAESKAAVSDVHSRLSIAKRCANEIEAICVSWRKEPILCRKDPKKPFLYKERAQKLTSRYDEFKTSSEKISALVEESRVTFEVPEDSDGAEWSNYLDYIDELVLSGLYEAIRVSIQYLIDNVNEAGLKAGDLGYFLEIKFSLIEPNMIFDPSLNDDETDDSSLVGTFRSFLSDIFHCSSLVKRISKNSSMPNYIDDCKDIEALNILSAQLMEVVRSTLATVLEYKASNESFQYLWKDDRQEYMRQFLAYGHLLTEEEVINAEGGVIPENPPNLGNFKEQIDNYEAIYGQVQKMEKMALFRGWLKVDANAFNQNLGNVVKKWSYMFIKYLTEKVQNSLEGLDEFTMTASNKMSEEVQEGDYEGLVNMMELLLAVRTRSQEADNMFEPLKETIDLLKQYDVEMPDQVYTLLHNLPEKWDNTKKISVVCKTQVAPLQDTEMALLKKRCDAFEMKNFEFREEFIKTGPFRYDMSAEEAYSNLDEKHKLITAMEDEAKELGQSAALFEVSVTEYKQLKQCRKEMPMLKALWDVIGFIQCMFKDWTTTLWNDINVDNMDMECKKVVKDMRGLDKEIRAWEAYTAIDSEVKNMMTSLRSVGELRNPAIRDRHWAQLTKATGVKFTMTDSTNLNDLLSLQLHKFEDDVRTIVDRAIKELSMEKILKDLDKIWGDMQFEYEQHSRQGVSLLKQSEELVETLEENQVTLQGLITSKFVAFFLEEVTKWQKTLSTVDSVLSAWMDVQRTWSHLESIFIGSEDIRKQLPGDSKRFDGIDKDFVEIMADAAKTPNVAEACLKPGLLEKLEALTDDLSLCEKALAEYLETKRLAFPRFYFISSPDLLDILSKGNMPEEVAKHLPKLFDNFSNLELAKDGSGNSTKEARGMYSREKEYVEFKTSTECKGQVENYLNLLMVEMRKTLRSILQEASVTYEEKPREQWLLDYPAQLALAGTQIWWTTEVNIAFGRLEEGYESALKEYSKKQIQQLTTLITMIQGELTPNDRQKIMTICTIDVHARDVIIKLIAEKAENSSAFFWQSQLRHRWDDTENDCFANICDAQFRYWYEYLGNTPRLVITPLTDRCYITLTQSLHLIMGGAPAGPAGTGKTETTKDLGKAIGMMVYVFNCSEQMDYKSVGNIYKGLAQSGAWGCFDEFNRISIEVLSVIAVQVKSIHEAIRQKKERFIFQGEEIGLIQTLGIWITMNPGYAGRTELPENLKALFRPCAMVVPDFELICEIMLLAEGFIGARELARKFVTLYSLNKELLSKQDHYDWGLRAIKSVLVVAGKLKRAEISVPEEHILMRALRDFNLPKIVTDDLPVFSGLILDLFPKIDIPRKRNLELEESIRKSTVALGLQAEENFVLKVVQLDELLAVRHSVFIIGAAGTGKSQCYKTLSKTYTSMGRKSLVVDLNPKTCSNDELFGYINPATREWRDGLFSCIMRDMAMVANDNPKWIVLDGDIDPMWIESLNTVMDDNKVLTLASNERVTLNPTMRLIFEIKDLKTATPATVSRAGILFLNANDVGWNPYVQTWLDKLEDQSMKSNLTILFEKYVPICLEKLRFNFKKVSPVTDMSMIQTLSYLLESLITPESCPPGCDKEWYEIYFVFAAIWAFGGAMFQDQLVDYRLEFSKWWSAEFKTIKLPSSGTVFDFFVDDASKKFLPWSEKVQPYEHDADIPLQAVLVETPETVKIRFFIDMLSDKARPVLLVGAAGSGKTVLVQSKLDSLDVDKTVVVNISFNSYTTAEMLQGVLEKPLEKKAGRNYGPQGNKNLIYFIDDLNMPEVDQYGTVSPHTLMRQHLDYSHWYDRQKLTLKDIHNCQYIAAMNPSAGSFTINPRLQRHFSVFAVSIPKPESLNTMYGSILSAHLSSGFSASVAKIGPKIVEASLTLHKRVASIFLPTAIKFHYIFNLRDLSNVFQGLLFSVGSSFPNPVDFVRLWLHESYRTYYDKFIDKNDQETFNGLCQENITKLFDEIDKEQLMAKPLIFCHFAEGIGDPKYLTIKDWGQLKKILEEGLEQYNETNAAMNLVLFEDAMEHICRVNRILENPRGNALLVGVGGSGKQSLARLAAFLGGLDVFQVALKKGYGIPDLKVDLGALYMKAGVKGIGMMFLMTDSQVADEKFLVLINDLLSSGQIPDLFPDDEAQNIINAMRPEVKGAGLLDNIENCWSWFISKVRKNLKVVLCFSPVGTTLRVRARKFPAVVNCTMIDWFHEWPQEALISVSQRFLSECELVSDDIRNSVCDFMAFVHKSVNEASYKYLLNERRYNYTTPKTFLEGIALYKSLLERQSNELTLKCERLENGLLKLQSTASQVDDLKAKLASQEIELKQKNEDADKLIKKVAEDTEVANKEKAIADEEEKKVQQINREVAEKQESCEKDLAAAEPALIAAEEALNTLNKGNLTELKSFGQPPDAVVNVVAAVYVLMSPPGKISKDRSWKTTKGMMAKVDQFLEALISYDKENIHQSNLQALQPYLKDPEFDPDFIKAKSLAAAGLCSWVINVVSFFNVYCDVEPKRLLLAEANQQLEDAQSKLSIIKAKIAALDENLAELTAEFEKATNEKLRCEEEATNTQQTLVLANRLINGLASENVRWAEAVENFKTQEKTLPGDVLISSAFLSYVGCFSKTYRLELLNDKWMPFVKGQSTPIPITEDLDPLSLLTDDAQIATWNNEGLPTDRVSIENASILTNCKRWPLIIDPQAQGIVWIKNRTPDLKAVRLGQRGYLDVIEKAVSNGDSVLIENIGEEIDPVLDSVLGRNTIKKGKYIMIGEKEVEYNQQFSLILHTKLANPHYKPEMQAQATLINFTVTMDGLEEQLLASVVGKERPDLEELKAELTLQQNQFKIKLKELEDALLSRLSAAEGNFLGDTALVENLETTKRTAAEIEVKVAEAKETEVNINTAREGYRIVAGRGSLLYFLLNELFKISPMYQYSLKAFKVVFEKAMDKAEPSEEVKERVPNLMDSITFSVFLYTTRGLFEKDKLIFTGQMCIQILRSQGEINPEELDWLLRCPTVVNASSPVDFLSDFCWGAAKHLSNMEAFRGFSADIEGSAKRWKKFVENETPEKEKFPQEWKSKTGLQRLCMMRALRPDRMTYAITDFVEEKLGSKYVNTGHQDLSISYGESDSNTPLFFILSPGVDPLKDLETLGRKLGFDDNNGNFHNVSLGQGQEIVAEQKVELAANEGHWVILQNIHLVAKWLPTLEKKMESCMAVAHEAFRLYLSADPPADPAYHVIPQGILQTSIKITDEPPTGIQANLHRALDNFNQDTLEMCSKEAEFKSILFSLCYFHSVILERRKFGPQGWNRPYPFNVGDLTISVNVLFNYLEPSPKVPWTNLRYLFGEIMYGGHITDDWDRRLCRTYLEEYIHESQLEGELEYAPGFMCPPNLDYKGYHEYIDSTLPTESPVLYGLHNNTEIGFLTTRANLVFKTIFEMQPKEGGGGSGITREEIVKQSLDEILEKLPEEFNMVELMGKTEDRSPYTVVCLQECDRMNILTGEIRRSLKELDLGLKGDLTISDVMDELMGSIFVDQVPGSWAKLASPSTIGLSVWFIELLEKAKQLDVWSQDFALPSCVWLPGLFNPQSFLTAVMQVTARKNEWPLDSMITMSEVTKKNKEDFSSPPREGAYIWGLFMEGARWDVGAGCIQESKLKELAPPMPVMFIKAATVDKKETKNVYDCPLYRTPIRGPTYIWAFNLKTKEKPNKWTLAGVALLLSVA